MLKDAADLRIKRERAILLAIAGILWAMNITMVLIMVPGPATKLNGELATPTDVVQASIVTLTFTIPIVTMVLGAIISMIPYRSLTYSRKYVHGWLVTLVFIYAIALGGYIWQSIMRS